MQRMIRVLVVAALVAIGSSTTIYAGMQVKQHAHRGAHAFAVAHSAACPVSNPALCGGSCSRTMGSTATSGAAVQHVNGTTCPVSDPSKCPASCRRDGAGTMAVNVRH